MMYQDRYWRELARRVGMENDPLVQRFVLSPALEPGSRWRKKVERLLRAKAACMTDYHPFQPPPDQQKASQGWIEIGKVIAGQGAGYPFRSLSSCLTQHVAVVGPTSSGKTVMVFLIAIQLHRHKIPVHLFDTEDEYAPWIASGRIPGLEDFLIISHDDLRFNTLFSPPPGVDPQVYITKSTSLLSECWFAGEGMINLIRDICSELSQSGRPFSWREVYERLIRMKFRLDSRTARYWESIKNRLLELLQYMGDVYGSVASHDLATIFRRSVLWRLRGLSTDHLLFFINNLVLWLTLFMDVSYDRATRLALVFEEFTRICNIQRLRNARVSEPLVMDLFRAGSKRGCSLFAVDQTPHLLPAPVSSNIGTWIVVGAGDSKFLDAVADVLVANPEQCDYLMRLNAGERREAVVKYPGHPYPFLVEIPEVAFPLGTPEQVLQREEWSLQQLGPPVVPKPIEKEAEPEGPGKEPTPSPYALSKDCLDYLVVCAEDWHMPATERDVKHGYSTWKGNKLRTQLEQEGLIKFHRVPTGAKGKVYTLTEVTNKGYQLLEKLQVSVRRPPGNGSFIHKWWQHGVYAWAVRHGYPAKIEEEVDGKAVDVGIHWEERWSAVEIVMGKKLNKELYNLGKDLERGFDRIVFCAVHQRTLEELRNKIEEEFNERILESGQVEFMRLRRFLEG